MCRKAVLQRLAGTREHNRNSINKDDPIVTDLGPLTRGQGDTEAARPPLSRLRATGGAPIQTFAFFKDTKPNFCNKFRFTQVNDDRNTWTLLLFSFFQEGGGWGFPSGGLILNTTMAFNLNGPILCQSHTKLKTTQRFVTNVCFGIFRIFLVKILICRFLCEVLMVTCSWLRLRSLNTSTGPPLLFPLQYKLFSVPCPEDLITKSGTETLRVLEVVI